MVAQPTPDSLDSSDVRRVVTDKGRAALRRYLIRGLLRADTEATASVMLPTVVGEYREITRDELLRSLHYFHPRTRRVVELHLIDGQSREVVAETLHVSLSTVARDLRLWWDVAAADI